MNQYSSSWLGLIQRPRLRSWSLPLGADEPLMPWITPPLSPAMYELFMTKGVEKEAAAGELLYKNGQDLSSMTLLTHGIAGRSFGNPYN